MNNEVPFDLVPLEVCVTVLNPTVCSERSQSGVLSKSRGWLGHFGLFPLQRRAHPTFLEKATVYPLASGILDLSLLPLLAQVPAARSISQLCTAARYRCTYGRQQSHFSRWSIQGRLCLGSWACSWTWPGLEQIHFRMVSHSWARVRWRLSDWFDSRHFSSRLVPTDTASNWHQLLRAWGSQDKGSRAVLVSKYELGWLGYFQYLGGLFRWRDCLWLRLWEFLLLFRPLQHLTDSSLNFFVAHLCNFGNLRDMPELLNEEKIRALCLRPRARAWRFVEWALCRQLTPQNTADWGSRAVSACPICLASEPQTFGLGPAQDFWGKTSTRPSIQRLHLDSAWCWGLNWANWTI